VKILKALAKKTDAKFIIACIDARMSQLYIGAYQKIDNKYILEILSNRINTLYISINISIFIYIYLSLFI